jgi:hypothetical protein
LHFVRVLAVPPGVTVKKTVTRIGGNLGTCSDSAPDVKKADKLIACPPGVRYRVSAAVRGFSRPQ